MYLYGKLKLIKIEMMQIFITNLLQNKKWLITIVLSSLEKVFWRLNQLVTTFGNIR